MKYYNVFDLYEENISLNDLIDTIKDCEDILEYYIILHNKDVKQDTGEVKKPHYHLTIGFNDYGRYTMNKVVDFFKPLTNYIESTKSIKKSIQYMVHYNDPLKYQYELNEIITNNTDKVKKQFEEKDKAINDILEEFITKIYNFEIGSNLDIIKYFQSVKKLNYCVSHFKYLLDVRDEIQKSYECSKKTKKIYEEEIKQ